jgi:hypothetical protein
LETIVSAAGRWQSSRGPKSRELALIACLGLALAACSSWRFDPVTHLRACAAGEPRDGSPAPGWESRLYLGSPTWSLLLWPVDPRPGEATYCVDDTGVVRRARDESLPVLAAGRCPAEWEPLP